MLTKPIFMHSEEDHYQLVLPTLHFSECANQLALGQFKQLHLNYVLDILAHGSGFVSNPMATFSTVVSTTH